MSSRSALLPLLLLMAAPACGPKTLKAKLINGERRATEADRALDEAAVQMRQLEPDAAAEAIAQAKAALSDPDVTYYPEAQMIADRLARAEAVLPRCREERAKRDLELAVAERKQEVEKAKSLLDEKRKALPRKDLERAHVEEARDAQEDLFEAIADGKELEGRDAPYAEFAKATRRHGKDATPEIELASLKVDFIEGPGGLRGEGGELLQDAKEESEKQKKIEIWVEAKAAFLGCGEKGRSIVGKNVALGTLPIKVNGSTTTPEALIVACDEKVTAIDELIVKAKAKKAKKAPPVAAKSVKAQKKPAPKKR